MFACYDKLSLKHKYNIDNFNFTSYIFILLFAYYTALSHSKEFESKVGFYLPQIL